MEKEIKKYRSKEESLKEEKNKADASDEYLNGTWYLDLLGDAVERGSHMVMTFFDKGCVLPNGDVIDDDFCVIIPNDEDYPEKISGVDNVLNTLDDWNITDGLRYWLTPEEINFLDKVFKKKFNCNWFEKNFKQQSDNESLKEGKFSDLLKKGLHKLDDIMFDKVPEYDYVLDLSDDADDIKRVFNETKGDEDEKIFQVIKYLVEVKKDRLIIELLNYDYDECYQVIGNEILNTVYDVTGPVDEALTEDISDVYLDYKDAIENSSKTKDTKLKALDELNVLWSKVNDEFDDMDFNKFKKQGLQIVKRFTESLTESEDNNKKLLVEEWYGFVKDELDYKFREEPDTLQDILCSAEDYSDYISTDDISYFWEHYLTNRDKMDIIIDFADDIDDEDDIWNIAYDCINTHLYHCDILSNKFAGYIADKGFSNAVPIGESIVLNESSSVLWGIGNAKEYLSKLSDSELKNELLKIGYTEDEIKDKSNNELIKLVTEDQFVDEIDEDMFYDTIVPMINKQTNKGIVLMSGTVARWDGNIEGGKAVESHELYDGGWDINKMEIIEDDIGNLLWKGYHHDGTHLMNLYAVPTDDDELKKFITDLGLDEVESKWYGYNKEDAIDMAIEDLSVTFLNDAIDDWSKVKEFCKPLRNGLRADVE